MVTFFLTTLGALFSVVNPIGTMPIFVGLTSDYSPSEKNSTARKTSIFFMIILLISFFLGKYILTLFGISLEALKIGGGLIIASSGFALLTGKFSQHKGMDKRVKDDAFTREDCSLTPLAIPMLAGPGSISLLITLNQQNENIINKLIIVFSVFCIGVLTWLILKSSHIIVKRLGASGLNSISRIIGFIVISLGIEYIISAVRVILSEI